MTPENHRGLPRTRGFVLLVTLLVLAAGGGFEAPATLVQMAPAPEGFEAEENVVEELVTRSARRGVARRERREAADTSFPRGGAGSGHTARADAPRRHETGRERRHRHRSLLI